MCEYMQFSQLPRFVVFAPASENMAYGFPLTYRKNLNNFLRFVVREWPEAYTQNPLQSPPREPLSTWDDWMQWFHRNKESLMEETAGFMADWGYYWLEYNTIAFLAFTMIIGPFFMTYQSYHMIQRTYKQFFGANKEATPIEDDDEFEKDESATPKKPTDAIAEKEEPKKEK